MGDQTFLLNGGTDGSPATAANTGLTTVLTSGGGVAIYSAAMAQEGACGLSLTNGSTTVTSFARATADSVSLLGALREYITIPSTLPAAGTQLWLWNLHPVGSNSTRLLNLRIDSAGKVEMLDQSNASQSATTHPSWGQLKVNGSTTTDLVLVAGTRYRVERQWEVGTTTSNGYWAVQIYPVTGTTSTPLNNTSHASALNTAANLGTVEWNTEETGIVNTGAVFTVGIDTITLRTGSRSPIGDYTVPTIYVSTTEPTAAGSWTKNGTGLVLADADPATGYTSANNPAGSPLRDTMQPIAKPAAGVDLVMPLDVGQSGATTATMVVKLYAPGGYTTLLATSQTATITATTAQVVAGTNTPLNVTFTAASIAAITDVQFAGGLRVEYLGTAS